MTNIPLRIEIGVVPMCRQKYRVRQTVSTHPVVKVAANTEYGIVEFLPEYRMHSNSSDEVDCSGYFPFSLWGNRLDGFRCSTTWTQEIDQKTRSVPEKMGLLSGAKQTTSNYGLEHHQACIGDIPLVRLWRLSRTGQ